MSSKQVVLELNGKWVLEHKEDDKLPIAKFIDSISHSLKEDIEVKNSTFTECTILVRDIGIGINELRILINSILKEKLGVFSPDEIAKISITEIDTVDEPKDKGSIIKSVYEEELTITTDAKSDKIKVMTTEEKIKLLTGAEDFKKLAKEIVSITPFILKHKTFEVFSSQNYLISINDGCGYTTCLKLFTDLLSEKGLFKFSENRKEVEVKLLSSNDKDESFSPLMSVLQEFGLKGGYLISIDISEWISRIRDRKFRNLLSLVDTFSISNIFVFRIPFVEYSVLDDIQASLQDILFIRTVTFTPLNIDELTTHAKNFISKFGFTTTEEVWDLFRNRVTEEKGDGKFYGFKTVNKIVREMIYLKHLNDNMSGKDDTLITRNDIALLSNKSNNDMLNGIDMLNDMVGMEKIQESIKEIIAHIELSLRNKKIEYPCIHMRFIGSPGTGKTTVARIVGRILKEQGILRNGYFFEYSGRDFCGRYVGETAPKTASICRDAYGSLLFIDEAYSLYREDNSGHDFGREALDTLIAEMENHRRDLVVIMAGYTDEMEELMKGNTGLESRMPYVIEFPNYTRDQLCNIYFKMLNDIYEYDDDFKAVVIEYFNSISDEVLNSKKFSNARFVRNLYERTCAKASMRNTLSKPEKLHLLKEDFNMASSERVFHELLIKKEQNRIGF